MSIKSTHYHWPSLSFIFICNIPSSGLNSPWYISIKIYLIFMIYYLSISAYFSTSLSQITSEYFFLLIFCVPNFKYLTLSPRSIHFTHILPPIITIALQVSHRIYHLLAALRPWACYLTSLRQHAPWSKGNDSHY